MNAADAGTLLTPLGGRTFLFAIATTQEYGPHLAERIVPLVTGVGPVEAAASVAAVLGALRQGPGLPDFVVSLGSAGSRRLEHAEIYEITAVHYRDMDASAIGFPRGVTPFLDEPPVFTLPARLGLPTASIATGASIVNGEAYDAIGADMADMETYAVARAARRAGVPLIGVRGVSDGRNALAKLSDWTEYLHVIDEKLAACVDRIATLAAAGGLSRDA